MSKTVQHKGGSTVQNNSYTGAPREITVDTTKNTLRVHDGVTPGGTELARISDLVSSVYTAGDGLTLTGVDFRVNAGAGVAISSDNVVIDLYPSSGLMTTVDGTAPSSSTNAQLSLTKTGVAAGTYRSLTVDVYGRVTAGTNPTTLAGYGILDAQPLDADLTSIAGLAGTNGLLRKTAANTWALDTAAYLPVTVTSPVAGQLVVFDGTQWINSPAPTVVKAIYTGEVPAASGTTTHDLSAAPSIATGTRLWITTITPKTASSRFVVQFNAITDVSIIYRGVSAVLYVNNTFNNGAIQWQDSAKPGMISLLATFTASSAAPITFELRTGIVGGNGTWYYSNSSNSSHGFGGQASGVWTITEYLN